MDELVKAIEAMQSGDDSAFQTIYGATYKQTLSVIRKYCNDADAYDDLLQDTYIQFYNHIRQVKDPSAVQAWLNTTAGRIARDYGISHSKHEMKPLSELEDEDGNPVEIEDENEAVRPELIADRKALTEIVNQVLELLPAEQREVLLMVYGQRTTIREMAAKLQVSENTIKSRLYQGRQKLMAHKADFRRLGVELPAVGIATVIAVTFEENMAAQAAVGAAAGTVFANTSAGGSTGAATADSPMAASSISSTASSAAASGATAAAGTKAAAVGMSIGVKAVIGLVSAAVIAGGGAAAVKTMVLDKQSSTQSETVTDETAETDAADNAQDKAELNSIHEPDWLLEDLNLTPNQIIAKYGEPNKFDSFGFNEPSVSEFFNYADKSYVFHAITNSWTGSNDDPYSVIIKLTSASALGVTGKIDIQDFIDSIGGTVCSYYYWKEDYLDEGSDLDPWNRKTGQTSVDILSQNNVVYELVLDDPSIVDPNNANDFVTARLKEIYSNQVEYDDKTNEFYDYLTTYGYTGLNDGAAADKAAANAENIKAYYAMIQSDESQRYLNGDGIEALQWQLGDIDGDGTDEIMFATGSYNVSSVGIGKMIDGKAVFIGSPGRTGAITYYPGTGYIHEEGYGAGGWWETLYVINGNTLNVDVSVGYSREYSVEINDTIDELYDTYLKGAEIPVVNGQDNEAVAYLEQFKKSHGEGVSFAYDYYQRENHTYDELKTLASR